MSNRLTIGVEGIGDAALVADIESTIRESFHEMALSGAWNVIVRPSPVRGRWDFRIHGLDMRHTMSIATPPKLLSSLIPRRLRESFDRFGLSRSEPVAARSRDRASGVTLRTVNTVSPTNVPVGTL